MTPEERIDADNRSVYVGNVRLVYLFIFILSIFSSHLWSDTLLNISQVDYGATADELEIHFNGCGPVNRVTILCDRFSGHPKGWVQLRAYSFFFFFYLTLFHHRIQLQACWHSSLFIFGLFSSPFTVLLTLSSLIETLCIVLLVCMRPCSEEESLRWGTLHYMLIWKENLKTSLLFSQMSAYNTISTMNTRFQDKAEMVRFK